MLGLPLDRAWLMGVEPGGALEGQGLSPALAAALPALVRDARRAALRMLDGLDPTDQGSDAAGRRRCRHLGSGRMIDDLKKSDFFVGLDERALEAIAGFTTRVTFEPNETVFERDDEARFVYEVVQGRVRQGFEVMPGSMVWFQTSEPGDLVGFDALIPPARPQHEGGGVRADGDGRPSTRTPSSATSRRTPTSASSSWSGSRRCCCSASTTRGCRSST